MSLQEHPDYNEENAKLQYILSLLDKYEKESAESKNDIDRQVEYSLRHFNSDNADQFNQLSLNLLNQEHLRKKLLDVGRAKIKPYFARIDFTPSDTCAIQRVYIGKMNFMRDDDNTILITDWRAPISDLYYEGRLGEASYICPDGVISGELSLKRIFTIENAVLKEVMDVDITTSDDFLQAALGSSKDKRLKDIVNTIQAEQNQIIRADLFRNIVVQGAAGGGKTTIALHRIAYLLYTYADKVKPEEIMIMAPNRFFISYISDVLPDLGVENIRQTTFEDFALDYMELRVKVKNPSQTLASLIENDLFENTATRVSSLKSSLNYKDLIENYIALIISRVLPDSDFSVEGYIIMKSAEIKELFVKDYAFMPVSRRIEKLRNVFQVKIKAKKESIPEWIEKVYDDRKEEIKRNQPDSEDRRRIITELLDERDSKIKKFRKGYKNAVKEYMKKVKLLTPLKYYFILFDKTEILNAVSKNMFTDEDLELIRCHSLDIMRKGTLETDDLAPLMYMHYRLLGSDDTYKQIVIDEAQDFSLFQLWMMQKVLPDAYFTILGDLSQGIFSYRGITHWDNVLAQIYAHKKPLYLTLVQSYRTTVEIMDKANEVISLLNDGRLPKSQPVIRHGAEVLTYTTRSLLEVASGIEHNIEEAKNDGYKSLAIICKTMAECMELQKLFSQQIPIITGNEQDYAGGTLLIPSYLVKGLEFDVVCIADASNRRFKENERDIKLLYIAMTRALHRLIIYAIGEKSGKIV